MPRTRTPPKQVTPGERVRLARAAAGLTQVQLADAAGLHKITISRIETGRYPLSIAAAIRIARATGVPPMHLRPDNFEAWAGRCPHCGKVIVRLSP